MAKKGYIKVTVDGITVSVKKDVFDNIDLIEATAELDSGNAFALPKILKTVFEGKEYDRVKKHLEVNGITRATDMNAFMEKVLTAANATLAKN